MQINLQERSSRPIRQSEIEADGQKKFIFDTIPLSYTDLSDNESPLRKSGNDMSAENRETKKNTATRLLI